MFGLLSLGYVKFIAKSKYKTTGSLIVHVENENGVINAGESSNLINTLLPIINDTDVIPTNASLLLENDGYEISNTNIRKNMVVTHNKSGRVISITYTGATSDESKMVLSALIESIMDLSKNENYQNMLHFNDSISVFDISDTETIAPNAIMIIFVGVMMGGIIGLTIVFVVKVVTSGFKTKEELEGALGVQVLGEIPEFKVRRN